MSYNAELIATSLKMLSALAIVIGGLFILLYLSKRFLKRGAGSSNGELIRILANSYLGVKKNISLVEVPGVILVLGITNDHIHLLTKIEDEEIVEKLRGYERGKASLQFSRQLNKLTSRFVSPQKLRAERSSSAERGSRGIS